MKLTQRQKEILQMLIDYINENGFSPSYRELCDIADVNSPATIWTHLKNLKNKGYIDYIPAKSRTIKILKGVE